MKYDDILEKIGEFGPYQQRMFYLVSLPIVLSGLQMLSIIFVYDVPSFRCSIPEYPNDTYEIQNEAHAWLVNQSIPPGDESVYSGCQIYTSSNDSYDNVSQAECSSRIFDKTDHENTIITEYDLVCGGEILRSLSNSISAVGALCGSWLIGVVADVFGRKKGLMLALSLQLVSSLIIALVNSFYVIVACRFFNGIATHGLFFLATTTGIELVGPKKRAFIGSVGELFWSAGVLLCLPIAYLIRQWRYTQLAIAMITVPCFGLWWLIPESPRWLLDKKRYAEVEDILRKMCKSNKCTLPEGAVADDTNDEGPQMSIRNMFTHRVLVVRSFIIFFNWLAVNVMYYGLTLNMVNLEGSPYINYLVGALVEAAGYVFCLLVMHAVPRRWFHCSIMMFGGLVCLGVIPAVLLGGDAWITTSLAMLGKFASSCAYTVLYLMSSELFPTLVRNSGIGCCSIFESIGGIMSPYIADLAILVPGVIGQVLPMVIFGGISLLAGGFSLFLPETRGRELPETIQDAINFGKRDQWKHRKIGDDKKYEMVSTRNPDKGS